MSERQVPLYHPELNQYALLPERATGHVAAQGWQVVLHPDDPARRSKSAEREPLPTPHGQPTLGTPAKSTKASKEK